MSTITKKPTENQLHAIQGYIALKEEEKELKNKIEKAKGELDKLIVAKPDVGSDIMFMDGDSKLISYRMMPGKKSIDTVTLETKYPVIYKELLKIGADYLQINIK